MMFDHRLLHLVGDAEIQHRRIGDEAAELHRDGIVEAELLPQLQPVLQRGVLADDLMDGVADVAKQQERQERHGEHDHERFEQPADGEREHA